MATYAILSRPSNPTLVCRSNPGRDRLAPRGRATRRGSPMPSTWEVWVWGAVFLLAYTYVGYPGLIPARSRLRPRPPRSRRADPSVTVLVTAYNEAGRISGRLSNLRALDYPKDRLEIV